MKGVNDVFPFPFLPFSISPLQKLQLNRTFANHANLIVGRVSCVRK
jgi:hypothetical protein